MSISEETTTVPQAPPSATAPGADIWDIDPVHSTVEFVVRHAFTRMRGRFGDVWGVLSIADPPERSTGHVEIAAGSIDMGQEGRDARHRRHARGLPRRGYRLPRRRPVPFPHVPHRCRCR